jgi:hypothetical protein
MECAWELRGKHGDLWLKREKIDARKIERLMYPIIDGHAQYQSFSFNKVWRPPNN